MKPIRKAFIIYPPTGLYMRDDRCQAPVNGMTSQPSRAPLDLAYMASVLEEAGIVCTIRDYPAESLGWSDFKSDLSKLDSDVLVISVTTPTLEKDLLACTIAKQMKPDILTVAKGSHCMYKDEEVMKRFKDLDVAVRGESEIAVKELILANDKSTVGGITYRSNGSVIRNPDRPFLRDLNIMPFPARHLLNNGLYTTPDTKEAITIIDTARGCPHKCVYCLAPLVNGREVRVRSPQRIVDEIEECVKKYKIRNFFLRADTFTWDKDWVIEICILIIKRRLNIRWATNSRVDTICEERLAWMKKSGCWIIGFGVESGNQQILDKMKKQSTLESARKAMKLCNKYNIRKYLLFIIGLPWDNLDSVRDTIRFAKELDGDFVDFNVAYPLPGTELYAVAKEHGLFDEQSLSKGDYALPIMRTLHLTIEELAELRRESVSSFYFRPKFIAKALIKNGISLKVIFNYLKAGISLFRNVISQKF